MNILFLILFQIFTLNAFATTLSSPEIKVYRNPTCNCCHKWINHLEENKFNVVDLLTTNMTQVKEAVKLPKQMTSCHTAIIEGYIIEGHVPANDIRRLLAEKPDIAGLSVPKMPVGTPGMEVGTRKDNFIVFQFDHDGHYGVFNQYQIDEHNEYQTSP
ncbi:MAG: copper amine oxidase [Methylophaga sp.]|nr:MAG: copper amine oxidase [Methylophaga sp.]